MENPKLTPKQRNFVNELLNDKKMSATQAAKNAYNTKTELSARAIGHENLTKPNIISALGRHNELVEGTLIGTIKDWGTSRNTRQREVAQDAAKYVHDKIHGKATQRVEQQSVSVEIAIDLT